MELELKLALPVQDPLLLEKQLARCPLIGRRKPQRQALHNTYYDTPEHALQAMSMALRVRQMGDAAQPRWVQTLKMGGTGDSAFSRRGEWEQPVPSAKLDSRMLADTPWTQLDADGALYQALIPVFTTDFERLSWVVTLAGAKLEIALDCGHVHMDGHSTPLCELEIELLEGPADAVFEAAWQIGLHISLLPLHMSKAERAYRLAEGTLDAPLRARPPALLDNFSFATLVQTVLRECFLQFTANLYTLRSSDAPEVLHQARVGWRRFKSALQLFKQRGAESTVPSLAPLKPLLLQMTALRDLDVAGSEVYPAYALAYQGGDPVRASQWSELEVALEHARRTQRAALRQTLADPALGRCLLQLTQWLETGAVQAVPGKPKKKDVTAWVRKRVEHLVEQLQTIAAQAEGAQAQHRLRITSKRLRYGVESLRALLPRKQAERWHQAATRAQTRIGIDRDRLQAIAIAERLQAGDGIVQFLRGAAFASGQTPHEGH
jgi:inorganic triphosphatase YgiF